MKKMKISEWLEFTQPKYIFLQLTPSFSIRNYNSDSFISLVARLYISMNDRINSINKKLVIEGNAKLSYYVYLEKSKVEFYFIVPEKHFNLFKDKIIGTWENKITITPVEKIPLFNLDCTMYAMVYKKHDALSLPCDKRNNTLLNQQLNTLRVMEQGDKIGIFYNFIPMSQKSWRSTWDNAIDDMREEISSIRTRSIIGSALLVALNFSMKVIDAILEAITMNTAKDHKKPMKDLDLSTATKKKRDESIAKTQIAILSEAIDRNRERQNAVSICNSFECLNVDSDNMLIPHEVNYKHRDKINFLDTKVKKFPINKMQPGECQHFIGLPAREALEQFPVIKRTETLECDTPAELRKGVICIGYNKYLNETEIKSYLPTGRNQRCWSLVIIGPTRAGKTTLLSNIANDATKGGECTIIFDFCGHCQLSDAVCAINHNILNIDCSDYKKLQGMGYNEVAESVDTFTQYENAKIKASQLQSLLDAVNDSDRDLKAKMAKYLKSAALVAFISNGSINDVFEVLLDHNVRYKYINSIPELQKENMSDKVLVLKELDEVNAKGKVYASKMNPAINGVMDRLDTLKTNTYMELMLKRDCSNNINLSNEIQKNQIICIRMPETMFSTEAEKDAYCTYWMSKIWLALKFRDSCIPSEKHTKVNIIIDELSQVAHCEEFVRSKLSQISRFNGKIIISCHYLNQIKIIRNELRSANASYMLISGCDKQNYDELDKELIPYTVDDLLHLKEHTSLNLIKTADGYVKFVTKLPDPIN